MELFLVIILHVLHTPEKFYNALLFDVVPVVYGGANYKAVAPNGSYIDVRDFASGNIGCIFTQTWHTQIPILQVVRHLAQYLKFLDKNDTAYLRYFDWRKSPSGLSPLPRFIQSWCTLCRYILFPLQFVHIMIIT